MDWGHERRPSDRLERIGPHSAVAPLRTTVGTVPIQTSRKSSRRSDDWPKLGLRLENHCVGLVVARQAAAGNSHGFELTFDRVTSDKSSPLLTGGDPRPLARALETLCDRHPLRRHPLAVSLDGDFCVTRVTVASPEDMPRSVNSLNERVNHYLQLGPGRKVTGAAQTALDEKTHYCATAVVAVGLIETLYEAFRIARLDLKWVEPSLISLARLVGRDHRFDGQTVMIADGTGERWDIGIVGDGRLWLDYRPTGAGTNQGIYRALDGHLTRLQRFCARHRRTNSDLISEMLVCGSGERAAETAKLLDRLPGLTTRVFEIESLDGLLHDLRNDAAVMPPSTSAFLNDAPESPLTQTSPATDRSIQPDEGLRRQADGTEVLRSDQSIAAEKVPLVAALLPAMMGVQRDQVPDVLEKIRRAPPRSTARLVFDCAAPILAAAVLVFMSLWHQQTVDNQLQDIAHQIETLEGQKEVRQVRNEQLMGRTREISNIERLASLAHIDRPIELIEKVTGCLPDNTRLLSWSMMGNHQIQMSAETQEESNLYETIETLQKIPRVKEINLVSTEPTEDLRGGLFVLTLWVSDRFGNDQGQSDAIAGRGDGEQR